MISPYGPAWIGSISSFAMSLSDNLRRLGVDCELLVNIGGIPGRTTMLRGPKPLFVIRAAIWLLRYRPRVLHAHAHWHTLLPAVLYKTFHRRVKVVFTIHTPQAREPLLSSWFISKLMAKCDVVTAVSDEIARDLRSKVPANVTVKKISPGATVRVGAYLESRRFLAIPEGCFVATFIGPLHWPAKVAGVKLLIHSFEGFSNHVPESRLLVVGGGPYLRELRTLVAAARADARIVLVGETMDPAPYLHACDVYAHISFMEGLPLSMLEAMLARKAVIASRVGAIPEVLEDGKSGILVRNNETEIVAALSRLHADHHLRDSLGQVGYETVAHHYTWDLVAQEFCSIYDGA